MLAELRWYLAYPWRDLTLLIATLERIGDVVTDEDAKLSDVLNVDAQRIGSVVGAIVMGLVMVVATYFLFELPVERAVWAFPAALAAWYLFTRNGHAKAKRIAKLYEIVEHANWIIRALPEQVWIEEAYFIDGVLVSFHLCYPKEWEDSKEANRKALEAHLFGKLGGIWMTEWDTENDFVLFEQPDLPDFIRPEKTIKPPWWLIEVGTGHQGEKIQWNLKKYAHVLLTAPTRSGKTSTVRCLLQRLYAEIMRALDADEDTWTLWGIDPKRLGLKFMRGRPNTAMVATTYDAMAEVVNRVHTEMMDWYERAENSVIKPDLLRHFLIVEEYATLFDMDGGTEKKLGPVCSKIVDIGRLGGEAGVHLCIIILQPKSRFLSTEFRGQILARCVVGPFQSAQDSIMVLGDDEGTRVPEHPGRVLWQFGGKKRRHLAQTPWVADPDMLDMELADVGMDPHLELKTASELFPPMVSVGPETLTADDWRGPEMMT